MYVAAGTVAGGRVVAFASDPQKGMGGAMGRRLPAHRGRDRHRASATRCRSSGCGTPAAPRLAEGVLSLHAVGQIFHAMTQASGQVPQISVVLGPAAGGAAYGPALTDIVILGRRAGSSSPARTWSARSPARTSTCCASAARSRTGAAPASCTSSPNPRPRPSSAARTLADAARRQGTLDAAAVADIDLSQCCRSQKRAYDVHPLVAAILDEGTVQ